MPINEAAFQETLVPYVQWRQPTPAEVNDLIAHLGLTDQGVAKLVGIKAGGGRNNNSTVYRWRTGATNIPYAAWCLLVYEAGYGVIWKQGKTPTV
jgi:hypothetical protein